jgi:hypothetical protein
MGKFGPGVVAVLILGSIALALGGCAGATLTPEETLQGASQELRQTVSKNVGDPGRRQQMLGLVDQIESTQRSFSAQAAEFAAQYSRMNADYGTARAQFEELFSDFNSRRIQSRDRILELHFQLAAMATAQEWIWIGKAEAKLYEETGKARAVEAGGA